MTEPTTEDKRDLKLEEKRKRAAEAREFLSRLSERYPACFTRDRDKVQPLAIGTQQKLRAELSADAEWQDAPGWLVRQALAIYTRSPAYLQATLEKRPRINLDGSTAGEVTEQEQEHARARLEEIKARREARRPAKGRPNRRPQPKRESQEDRTQRKLAQLAAKFAK